MQLSEEKDNCNNTMFKPLFEPSDYFQYTKIMSYCTALHSTGNMLQYNACINPNSPVKMRLQNARRYIEPFQDNRKLV